MRNNKLMMAFESLEDGTPVEAGTEDVAAIQADVVQADQAAEIGDVMEAVEELAEGSDQMEGVADRMEASLADDGEGYAPEAAAEATAALESLYKRIGLQGVRVMPALESFGSRNSRRATTKFAVEGIKEQVKKVWAAIKKFFKEMWDKIKGYYNSVFDGATKLKARAEAMTKKLEAETGSITETTFEDSTIVNQFAIKGAYKESNVLDIIGGAEALLKASNDVLHKSDAITNSIDDAIAKAGDAKAPVDDTVRAIAKMVKEMSSATATAAATAKKYGFEAGATVNSWEKLLGDKEFVIGVSAVDSAVIAGKDDVATPSFKFRAVVGSTGPNKDITTKVSTAKVDAMFKIVNEVSSLAQLCVDFKQNIAKVNGMAKAYDSMVTNAEKMAEKTVDSKDPKIKSALGTVKGLVKGVQSVMGKVSTFPLSNAIATGNAALGYCGANLSHYGTK